jgi:signal peptidase I
MSAPWRQGWAALAVSTVSRIALGALALLLAASVVPVLIGWQSSVVMSGSMAPTFSPGDVAVVRPVDPSSLEPGQILLVDDPDLPGQLRLHRLVAIEATGLQLKGDANPAADGSLVDPASVHGVVTVGLPLVGEPAVWIAQHRPWPLVGTLTGLAALMLLALVHRRPDGDPPVGPPLAGVVRRSRPRRLPARLLRRGTVLTAAVLVTVALPGAAAKFSDTTLSPNLTIPAAPWWNCADVSGPTGANAARYYALQESGGRTATNTGTNTTANGTYSSAGVTFQQSGPACGSGYDKAVTFNGTTGYMWTTQAMTNPQTFSVQTWFRTSTTVGGKLIGFGNGTNGADSSQYDRQVYMTNAGKLVFGIYDGSYVAVTSPLSYNDNRWHLVAATFSPTSGMRLYVDSALIGSATAGAAENYTGYWRIGYDVIHAAWPGAPQTGWFAGSMANVSIYTTVLSATQVAQAWQITR